MKELLELLKREALLADAKFRGAKAAYEQALLAEARCNNRLPSGQWVQVRLSDGDVGAFVFRHVGLEDECDDSCFAKVVLYGWRLSENGKRVGKMYPFATYAQYLIGDVTPIKGLK